MYLENFFTAFPGSKFEALLTVTQGDYVVTNWKVSGGAHTGPLRTPSGGTIPPTGKTRRSWAAQQRRSRTARSPHLDVLGHDLAVRPVGPAAAM